MSTLRSIGQTCKPPSFSGANVRRNTFTTNLHGDIALLHSDDGSLKVTNLRSNTNEVCLRDLPVEDIAMIRLQRFNNIEYNSDGSLLLLWSSESAGVIEIPRKLAPEGPLLNTQATSTDYRCKFTLIGQEYITEKGSLIHAAFHPLSASHIVLLVKGAVLLVDVSSEVDVRFYPIGVDHKFTSFCFGPSVDWMKFTVFLLSDRKGRTEIFAMCPVVPWGAIVPRAAVIDLWDWADEQETFTDPAYVRKVREYLTAAFGPRSEVEREQDIFGSNMASPGHGHVHPVLSYIRAGDFAATGGGAGVYAEMEAILSGTPALQGPLAVHNPSVCSNPLLSPGGLVALREPLSQRRPTDLCVPWVRGEGRGAPMLVVAFDNGEVEMLVMDAGAIVEGCGYVAPCWMSASTGTPGTPLSPGPGPYRAWGPALPPSLAVVETIRPGSPATANAMWSIDADPVASHCFHLTCWSPTHPCSFLICSVWLLKQLSAVHDEALPASLYGDHHHDDSAAEEKQSSAVPLYTPAICPSTCTAVFRPSAVGKGASAGAGLESSAGELVGTAIIFDHAQPLLGHSALFRQADGSLTSINLTVHMKLCELEVSLRLEDATATEASEARGLQSPSMESVAWERSTRQLLQQALQGLSTVPFPADDEADEAVADASAAAAHCSRSLIVASEHMEKHVATHLQELSRRLRYRMDILQDCYAAQVELLEGLDQGPGGSKSSTSSGGGLKAKMRDILINQDELKARLEAIHERALAQQERVALVHSGALRTRTKLSQKEFEFRAELNEWHNMVVHMDLSIEALRRQANKEKDKAKKSQLSPSLSRSGLSSSSSLSSTSASPAVATAGSAVSTSPHPSTTTPMADRKRALAGYRSPGFGNVPGGSAPRTPASYRPSGYMGKKTLQSSAVATPTTTSRPYPDSRHSPLPFSRAPPTPSPFRGPSDPLAPLTAIEINAYEEQLRAQAAIIEATRNKVATLERRVQEVKLAYRR